MRAAARDVFCIQLSVETLRTAPGNRRCNTESAHVAATATIWERHSTRAVPVSLYPKDERLTGTVQCGEAQHDQQQAKHEV